MGDALGSEDFGNNSDGYDQFIDNDEEGITKVDPNQEEYHGTQDYPEIDETMDNSDKEIEANSYDQ